MTNFSFTALSTAFTIVFEMAAAQMAPAHVATELAESDTVYLEDGDSLMVLAANGEPYFLPVPGMKRETIVIWRPRGLKAPEPIRIIPNVAPEPPPVPSR